LPDAVRAEALALAKRGEAHPDPVVAAIVVGRIREDRAQRRRILHPLYAPSIGVFIATAGAAGLTGRFALLLAAVPAFFLIGLHESPALLPWYVVRDSVPMTGEAPSVRAIVRAMPATEPQPLEVRRLHTPKDIAIGLITAVATAAPLLAIVPPAPGSNPALVGIGALVTPVLLLPFMPRIMRQAGLVRQPIRLDDDGLRFGTDPVIAWADVVGARLVGPTSAARTAPLMLIWQIRGRTPIRMRLDGLDTPPGAIILTARAYATAPETIS
jgi:hypothetical protein